MEEPSPSSKRPPSTGGGGRWSTLKETVSAFRSSSPSDGVSYLRRKSLEKAIGGSSADGDYWSREGYVRPDSFFDLACDDAKGSPFDFGALRDKVTIVVNVATL